MKTFVRWSGRWGVLIGVIAALSACGVGSSGGTSAGGDPLQRSGAGLTAPRPGDGLTSASGGGGEQLATPGAGATGSLAGSRELPLVNQLSPNASKSDPNHKEWHRDARAVAIEGEEAPGTGGQTFDDDGFEYADPSVNERGDIAFVASYGHELYPPPPIAPTDAASTGEAVRGPTLEHVPGAGVFFWDRSDDRLSPVALSGQEIDCGYFGGDATDFLWPTINDRNQIAFVAGDIVPKKIVTNVTGVTPTAVPPEALSSALIQANPENDRCERFDLKIIAERGDPAPGGGYFYDFALPAENENGDIAFLASYLDGAPDMVTAAPATAPVALLNTGVFLYMADQKKIIAIVRAGDELPHTDYGRLCTHEPRTLGGVWMNDDRVITFQANCIDSGTLTSTAAPTPSVVDNNLADGSIFIWRPHEDLRLFLKVGSRGPSLNPCGSCSYDDSGRHTTIVNIETDRPGLSENAMAFRLDLADGLLYSTVIASKRFDDTDYDADHVDVCAVEDEDLGRGYTLGLTLPAWTVGVPSYSSDGIFGFIGLLRGWENNCFVEKPAEFTCFQHQVHVIAAEGDEKPVGKHNTFGLLDDQSNSDRYVVFVDEYEESTVKPELRQEYSSHRPSGVFTANSNPQLP